jgi:hypothetical protein
MIGSLHVHYILWAGPPPRVFEASTLVGLEDLRDACADYLDSVCVSSLPRDVYVAGAERRVHTLPATRFGMSVSAIPKV